METTIQLTSPPNLYGTDGRLTVEHSAFDHIEPNASIVIVGITPGAQQRDLADSAYRAAVARGVSPAEASRAAKFAASFGGAMRSNLVRMLDSVGAAGALGLSTFASAFEPTTRGLVHFTSALRYPTFIDGANYNGQVPMLGSPLLRQMTETLLAEEVRALPNAVWQPLGDKPMAALEHLVARGVLRRSQIAPALPHPSGANAERIAYFTGGKSAALLSAKTNAAKLDLLRQQLIDFYCGFALRQEGR